MPMNCCLGAQMMCTFGLAPSALVPTVKMMNTAGVLAANIMDFVPMVNIPPFAMCTSPANPAVAAATTAAAGVLTPMPCVPVPVGPWKPGAPTVMLGGAPALDNTSTLNCTWGGVITFITPGQFTHMIP